MIAVDTNVVVRLITHDDEKQYKKAFHLFSSQQVFIPDTVILETEWVLRYAYEFSASAIRKALYGLFGLNNVHLFNPTLISQALGWNAEGLDFSDAMHLAQSHKCEQLHTFDKSFSARGAELSPCPVTLL